MAESSTSRLEPFVLLARYAKGKTAAKIIEDATSTPGVYVFGELLESPSIQQIRHDPEGSKSFNLLQLFAYGDLRSIPAQLKKLQHLTLLSLASESRSISYSAAKGDDLLRLLRLSSLGELENMIIDVIYAGQLQGKIHHHERVFHVEWVAGRDVSPDKLPEVQLKLSNWCKTAETLLTALDNQIGTLQAYSAEEAKRRAAYKQARDEAYLEATKRPEKEQGQRVLDFADNDDEALRAQDASRMSGSAGGRDASGGLRIPATAGARSDEAERSSKRKRQLSAQNSQRP